MKVEPAATSAMARQPHAGAADAGAFRVIRALGEGGYGQVFEAWDARLCRSVALKQLRRGGPQHDVLMREARLAASLRHAAFVKIFSVDETGDTQSIVMELVRGVTLREHCRQQRPASWFMLDTLDQVAEAMAEAHAAGLVHGDLKPSNLMIEPSGRVRILDFGLARQADPLATESEPLAEAQGTIAFMAPERLMGKAPSGQADIYALGVILYDMMHGALPFDSLNGLALAAAHIQSGADSWQFAQDADPALVRLVLRMCARDPARRTSGMQALRREIAAARAAPGGPRHRSWRARLALPGGARKGLIGAAVALAAAGLAALAWHALPDQGRAVLRAPLFSEASSMRAGLEALRMSDRPGNIGAAIAHFNAIAARNPGSAPANAGLALAYGLRYASDERDVAWLGRADAAAQAALAQDPNLALPHVALGAAREYQNRYPDALRALERALALDPRNLFALAAKGRLLTKMGQYGRAEQAIAAGAALYPRERRFADLLGALRFAEGEYAAAEHAFRRSLALEPDAVFAYANLNATLLRLDRTDEALQVLQQGLQIRPNSFLYSNLGATLFARGDYPGAVQAFERAVSANGGSPNYYLMWANLGDALRWLPGREAEARAAYLRATQLLAPQARQSPGNHTLASRLGLYYAQQGDAAESRAWTGRALAAAPANAEVQFRAAMASELGQQRERALAHVLRALALGYPLNLIESEPDFIALRRDPRYQTASSKGKQ